MKISVSMITMNEEKNIARALSSCIFADEIVVVDGGSTDRTLDILKSYDRVVMIENPWENHFGNQRQISLEHCTGDWVIRLDADEAFSGEFEKHIRDLLSSTPDDTVAYKIRQCNLIGNTDYYSKIFDDYESIPRVWKNLPGIRWDGPIHETLIGINGIVKREDVYVVHYGFLDRKRYWQKGEYYSQVPGSGLKKPEKLYYREYDIQPRPSGAAVAPHVPECRTEEDPGGPPEIAVVRGADLNKSETLYYEPLSDKFNITLYASDRPNFDLTHIKLPVIKLPSETGNPAFLEGLEFELFDKDIVYTADILLDFTRQAVNAGLKFGKKIIALAPEKIPFTHEENEVARSRKQSIMRFVDIFVAVTKRAKDALLLEGVPEEKIVVIPMGTDTGRSGPDKIAQRFALLFGEVFQSTYKGVVCELAGYKGLSVREILGSESQAPLLAEIKYNYDNQDYLNYSNGLMEFCRENLPEHGEVIILDFGGIGTQLINLSKLKDIKLCYADVPGRKYDYTRWRLKQRGIDAEIIDAGRHNYLDSRRFYAVIISDISGHPAGLEETIQYLVEHLKHNGLLIMPGSFEHENGDRNTDEGVYSILKNRCMVRLDYTSLMIFMKNEELANMIPEIRSAAGEGRFEDCRRHIEAYLELNPFDMDMLVKYADVCSRLGAYDIALESIEKVLLFSPDMQEALEIEEKIRRRDNEHIL
jgi:glycosyltransferase involved in cell wall biosynthesis/tetratricopeptide (TPR) repeat protein